MTSRADALRGRFTPRERELMKRLIDAEVRRRDDADREQLAASKRRYEARVAAMKRVSP
jgi:hypothetical protein